MIAHEVKNPLTIIAGLIRYLKEQPGDTKYQYTAKYLESDFGQDALNSKLPHNMPAKNLSAIVSYLSPEILYNMKCGNI